MNDFFTWIEIQWYTFLGSIEPDPGRRWQYERYVNSLRRRK